MSEMRKVAATVDRLREAMRDAGKRQTDLAAAAGLNRSTVSRYLNGTCEPKQAAIYKLAALLDVSEMWLWGYDVPRERSAGQKKNDALSGVVVKLRKDPDFFDLVVGLSELTEKQRASVAAMVSAFRE